MAIDGVEPDLVEERLTVEVTGMEERHLRTRATFDTMATFAPAFGMIGTIMGLVLVLKGLDNPSRLGPKMGVALLSTFYGVFTCYAIFTPISKKLERKHKHENLYREMIVRGIFWLQTGDSPRTIEAKLRSFLR
jgi:chemotaxis protein MotA